MKRNSVVIVAAAVAMLGAWSCQKEKESPVSGNPSKISVSVTAEMEDLGESDVKASIGTVYRLSWTAGDKVFVYDGEKWLGDLTVSLNKDSDKRYAYLGGEINAPTDDSKKLTCVYAKGIETAPEVVNGEVKFSMADQTAGDTPFVVYGTIDYSGQKEIENQLVDFKFATAVVLVNCLDLAADGGKVTKAVLSGINTNCVLSLSGTADPEVVADTEVGTIITTEGTFKSGNGKLTYQIGIPVSPEAETQRKLTITQANKTETRSTNFTSSAFAAGKFVNVIYTLEEHQYTVSLSVDPTEGGSVTFKGETSVTSKTVSEGTKLTIVATANNGYTFTGWTRNDETEVISTEVEYLITVEADVTYLARFEEQKPQADGSLPGVFSVSPTQKVKFSQGNLQYQASTNTWRFAEHQYDHVGDGGTTAGNVAGSDNTQISSTYSGWIDLFGWATSGYPDYRKNTECPYPYTLGGQATPFKINGGNEIALTIEHYTDWGVNNIKIFDGEKYVEGKPASGWRTLKGAEWNYVIGANGDTHREDECRFMLCKCSESIYGVLIFPDEWTIEDWPDNSGNKPTKDEYNVNTGKALPSLSISLEILGKLQEKGVVFLPQTGYRTGTASPATFNFSKVASSYKLLYYWAADGKSGSYSYCLIYSVKTTNSLRDLESTQNKHYGYAVRLVTDVPSN